MVAFLVAALFGCDSTNAFESNTSTSPETDLSPTVEPPTLDEPILADDEPILELEEEMAPVPTDVPVGPAISFAGGIPIGLSSQPTNQFGSRYNGALRNIWPSYLREQLAAIKQRGGKVALSFSGNHRYYVDGDGHFSMTKWKDRVAKFKNVNFGSYVDDGTIIGHYMIDEPNDARNWGGRPVTPDQLEEMARYSKQLWPNLPTIVRVQPDYLKSSHRYLDAAWAQYLARRGNVGDYIRQQVSAAQNRGLALVVGLNIIHGGSPSGTKMTGREIREWGSALLNSSYPCAFISWQHNSYAYSDDVKSAMSYLREKAESRSTKRCRG
jgi:hypothetical protein